MMHANLMIGRYTINKIIESLYLLSDAITVVTLISSDKLQSRLEDELTNNPELFFVNGFKVMYSPATTVVYPCYSYDEPTLTTTLDLCRKTAERLVSRIHGEDDYDRALQAHDFLARNVIYVNSNDRELHTIVGPLSKKQAVCEGFAKAFKYMLDMMHIPCLIVYGFGCDPNVGVEERHAWNLIHLDGKWVHVDVTFDATIRSGQVLRYDYFGLSNEQILRDHKYEVEKYPLSNTYGYGYYERNNLVMSTRKKMKEYITDGFCSGKLDYVFKLPDTATEENLDIKVSSEIQDILRQRGVAYPYIMYFNLKQRVFHISFEKGMYGE